MYFESPIFSNLFIPVERLGFVVEVNTPNPFNDIMLLSISVVDLKYTTMMPVWIQEEISPEECRDEISCLEMAERLIFEKIGHDIECPIFVVSPKTRSKDIEIRFFNRRRRV